MDIYFDKNGNFIGKFPKKCVEECSGPGQKYSDVKFWQEKLNFFVPRKKAIKYLKEFGAWSIFELEEKTDIELSQTVLWIACGDIRENGEWFGLTS